MIDNAKILVEDLPRLARAIIRNNERYNKAIANNKFEIERLKSWIKTNETNRDKAHTYLMGKAKSIMDITGEKVVEYSGLGKFRYQEPRDRVDTSLYEALPDDNKGDLLTHHKGLFIEKYSFAPALKEIKKAFKNGEVVPDCFIIDHGNRELVFIDTPQIEDVPKPQPPCHKV